VLAVDHTVAVGVVPETRGADLELDRVRDAGGRDDGRGVAVVRVRALLGLEVVGGAVLVGVGGRVREPRAGRVARGAVGDAGAGGRARRSDHRGNVTLTLGGSGGVPRRGIADQVEQRARRAGGLTRAAA